MTMYIVDAFVQKAHDKRLDGIITQWRLLNSKAHMNTDHN